MLYLTISKVRALKADTYDMSLFNFENYREYLQDHLRKLPKKGHGELSKMAKALGVHSTLMSLILSGDRELTLEQAFDLAKYLQLTDLETEYLSLLVQHARAGNHRYQGFILEKLEKIRREATQISKRFDHEKKLSEHDRTTFYSSWMYSALRLYASTAEDGKSVEELVDKFQLPRPKIIQLLEFLQSAGLVIKEKEKYKMGPQRTFLEFGSPHLLKHLSNWRMKALQRADELTEKELMFSSPISVSRADFQKIREQLADYIKQFSQIVKDSPAEDIACLNIDFFWIGK